MKLPLSAKPILTIGDVNPDIVLPLKGSQIDPASVTENSDLLRAHISGGGTVANVASGLGRMLIPVAFCGKIGHDALGKLMMDEMRNDSVDISHVVIDPEAYTNMVFAVVHPNGERTIFVWPPSGAAHARLTHDDISFDYRQFSLIHSSSICLREDPSAESIVWFLQQIEDPTVVKSFDLNLRSEFFESDPLFSQYLEQTIQISDIIFGSAADEIMPLTGINDPEKAARSLAPGACVIARMGKDGALCIDGDSTTHIPAYYVPVVDTIGAGDAFNSGFLAALYRKKSPQIAAIWGNACAAISISKPNARSCPTYAEFKSFIESNHSPDEIEDILP